MKAAEVHKMSNDELTVEAERLRRKLFDLRAQAVTQKLDNPRQLATMRRDVARILTEQKQRQSKQKA